MKDFDGFSSFNARSLPPRALVGSFIPPSQFPVLARPTNAVLVGPRGSGKTTLLKMLTPEALTNEAANRVLEDIAPVSFTGVFIPTDINWQKQLKQYMLLNWDDASGEALVRANFNTTVFRALTSSLHQRVRSAEAEQTGKLGVTPLHLERQREVDLVTELARIWNLAVPIPSLLGVRAALSQRIRALASLALAEHRAPAKGRQERLSESGHLDVPLLEAITSVLDSLEAVAPECEGERWALCFDELELAPDQIRSDLLAALRSVDDRLLFKLSLSPFNAELTDFTSALSAMPAHDHEEISLSYGRKESGLSFSLELMQAIVDRSGRRPSDLEKLLGIPDFAVKGHTHTDPLNARVTRAFRILYGKDESFRTYVHQHADDLESFLALRGDERAQLVRKIIPLVIVRSVYRNPDVSRTETSRVYRTRKNPDIYRGATSIATMLEGNPRYIIGVMNSLLTSSKEGSIGGPRQSAELRRAANRLRALLTTIPGPEIGTGSARRRRGLLEVVDTVGYFFRDRVLADAFNPDPVGSFYVDADVDPDMLTALANLVNAGALVYVPDVEGGAVVSSLRERRLRLNYLLASYYGLPLRLERKIDLSNLLMDGTCNFPDPAEIEQPRLFE